MLTVRELTRATAVLATLLIGGFVMLGPHVAAIARGYVTSDEGLSAGMVAALSKEGDSQVERADQTTSKRIVGVVTTFEAASVTLASGTSKILIESEGEVGAYVSDISGEVNKGDLLTLSPLKGILMKAGDTSIRPIIAVASESSATANKENAKSYTYQDGGTAKNTQIVKLKVNLNKQGAATTTQAPSSSVLSDIGQSVTGKKVSDMRVLSALVIFILVMIAEGGIIYGAVSSAITSLGRNPLARKSIFSEMIRVSIVALVVLCIALGAVYGILWY